MVASGIPQLSGLKEIGLSGVRFAENEDMLQRWAGPTALLRSPRPGPSDKKDMTGISHVHPTLRALDQ